jgi:hypothetical protein
MSKTSVDLRLRLPPDAKAFLKAEAEENSSSQNSEVVRAIRERMKAKGPAGAETPPSHDSHNSPTGEEHEHAIE